MLRPVLVTVALSVVGVLQAQTVISVKAGLIHYVEGQVFVDEKATLPKFGQFPEMKQGSVLRTARGRAEVLLAPGVFLRVAEDTAFRMVSNDLSDTRVGLLKGAVLVECAELLEGNSARIEVAGAVVHLKKAGLYRVEAEEPAEVLVYDGRAEISLDGQSLVAGKGRRVSLEAPLAARKFDTNQSDALYRWSARRSGYVAMANVSSAKSLRDNDIRWSRSGWIWNRYLGLFTFIPGRGHIYSPFGYSYYGPSQVYIVYTPRVSASAMASGFDRPVYNPSLGYSTVSGRTYDSGSVGASSGPAAAPAASPRTSESASPRGGEGGGRGQ